MTSYKEGKEFRLEAGHELPVVHYTLDRTTIDTYLSAVEETSRLYNDTDLVPPTAVAALAMAALAEGAEFPPGSIHVSQKLDFKRSIRRGDTVYCRSIISRVYRRAGMHLITIELHVEDNEACEVLSGEISFVAPQESRNEGK
jgi:acyl dehydratase